MQIERIIVGGLETNCYILSIDDECLIIDPGDDFELIVDKINDKKVLGILITHNHFDHIGVLDELLKKYNTKVFDKYNLLEKKYVLGNFKFEVIYTIGHTNDSITFYFKEYNSMFTGDFIFKNTIGRWDLPTGNFADMIDSIKKISKYEGDIRIYPGHGEFTNLDDEKKSFDIYTKRIG